MRHLSILGFGLTINPTINKSRAFQSEVELGGQDRSLELSQRAESESSNVEGSTGVKNHYQESKDC